VFEKNCCKKIVEGGWTSKSPIDVWWSTCCPCPS
jgi:hypothetical protein